MRKSQAAGAQHAGRPRLIDTQRPLARGAEIGGNQRRTRVIHQLHRTYALAGSGWRQVHHYGAGCVCAISRGRRISPDKRHFNSEGFDGRI
jgi:hypothetical protein